MAGFDCGFGGAGPRGFGELDGVAALDSEDDDDELSLLFLLGEATCSLGATGLCLRAGFQK